MALIQQGGATLILLIICSIFLFTVTVERFLYYYKSTANQDLFLTHLETLLQDQKIEEAATLCATTPGFLPAVLKEGLKKRGQPREICMDAMKIALLEQNAKMEKFVPAVGTLAVIAPFIGLFGTVLGIIRAFQEIAIKKSAGAEVVAGGVAEALVTTAAGLFVAILSVVFYNILKSIIKKAGIEMAIVANRLVDYVNNPKST